MITLSGWRKPEGDRHYHWFDVNGWAACQNRFWSGIDSEPPVAEPPESECCKQCIVQLRAMREARKEEATA
jgi:hypothetical protein